MGQGENGNLRFSNIIGKAKETHWANALQDQKRAHKLRNSATRRRKKCEAGVSIDPRKPKVSAELMEDMSLLKSVN